MAVAIQLYNKSGAKAYAAPYWPIGSIYLSMVNTNPSTWFGGKWSLIAQGRTLVGVNTSDNDFKTPNKAGGNKSHTHSTGNHTLTINEIPEHSHEIPDRYVAWDFGGNGTNAAAGSWGATSIQFHPWGTRTFNAGANWAHNHGNTGSTSNLPPYLTCYIWQRTA